MNTFHTDRSITQNGLKVELHASTKRDSNTRENVKAAQVVNRKLRNIVKERLAKIEGTRRETARTLEEIVFSIDQELEKKPVSGRPGKRNQRLQERESKDVLHGGPVKREVNPVARAFKGAEVTFK